MFNFTWLAVQLKLWMGYTIVSLWSIVTGTSNYIYTLVCKKLYRVVHFKNRVSASINSAKPWIVTGWPVDQIIMTHHATAMSGSACVLKTSSPLNFFPRQRLYGTFGYRAHAPIERAIQPTYNIRKLFHVWWFCIERPIITHWNSHANGNSQRKDHEYCLFWKVWQPNRHQSE